MTIAAFLSVFDAYVASTKLSPATVSRHLLGRGSRIADLRAGGDIGVQTLERALLDLSSSWPEGAAWPADVSRPALAEPALAESEAGHG